MKSIEKLIEETKEVESLEELESSADLLDFGIEKGWYDKKDVKDFYGIYGEIKDKLITNEVSSRIESNYLKTLVFVENYKGTKEKDNIEDIIKFVKGEFARVYKNNKNFKVKNKFD